MKTIKFKYGVHNGQIKLYAISDTCRRKRVLSFFGPQYSVKTSVKYWDKDRECFLLYVEKGIPIPTASEDNMKLRILKETLQEFENSHQCYDCDKFFNYYKEHVNNQNNNVPILLEYVKDFAQLWKDNKVMGKGYKYDSGNYVIYEKLARRLQGFQYKKIQPWAVGIKKFANTPITEIGSKEYNDFLYFLIMNNLPVKDSINAFRSTVYYYRHWVMNDDSFKFQLNEKYKRILQNSKKKKQQSITLSSEQLCQLANLNTESIPLNINNNLKQLYKDTLLLMYGLATRPFDILSMRIEDIKVRKGRAYYWVYCANKLRNTKGKNDETPIQPGCWRILNKYINGRKHGFVLPFAINKTEEPQQKRKVQVNHTTTKIGNFLKEIAKYYNWDVDVDRISMYTLRHTAITDLLKSYSCNIVAVWAHTSVKEINDTYEDRQNLAVSAFPDNFSILGKY